MDEIVREYNKELEKKFNQYNYQCFCGSEDFYVYKKFPEEYTETLLKNKMSNKYYEIIKNDESEIQNIKKSYKSDFNGIIGKCQTCGYKACLTDNLI